MDLRKLKTLIDLVSESNISELEITEADGKVRIVKSDPAAAVAVQPVYAAAPAAPVVTAAAPVAAPAVAAAAPAAAPVETGHVVKSPMVGTFYRSASPGSEAFVKEGQAVSIGDTLCLIEAMKLMNEIESETDGRIVKILAESTKSVEYGQALFLIDPKATP